MLKISERTLYRDLDALREGGFPCRFDKEKGGIEFMGDYFLPPTQLTLGEALALSVLGSELAGKKQFPLMQDAWQAVIKIRRQLPAAMRDEISAADGVVRVQGRGCRRRRTARSIATHSGGRSLRHGK